ncbi:MAG: metallophosphoesterase [Streptosporangiaceae bacterium]
MRVRTLLGAAATVSALGLGYSAVIERNWFALRRHDVPVLAPGAAPLRILHMSDIHLTPGRHRLLSWIRALDALAPDLVVNTGDSIAHQDAVGPLLDALGPLLNRPGVFVYGSNDLYSPIPRNPLRYIWRTSADERDRVVPDLPWPELGAALENAGWLNANNRRGRVKAGDLDIEVAGVHDSHVGRDRYDKVAGPADPAADLRLGVLHSPEPRVLDRFVDDGFDLLLAGHTHGGQVCLPGTGALVTNCGIDRERASGLHHHPAGGRAWLHVSAGLGTSPYTPVRFFCRPEATLLTLVPEMS